MKLPSIRLKTKLWLCIGSGCMLLILSGWLWCARIHNTPERVFWSTIEQGLKTRSVTIQAKNTQGATTLEQNLQFAFGSKNGSHSLVKLSQQGTTVQNETIGTLDTDYTRYKDIQTDQKRPDGKELALANVVGVWAKGKLNENQLFKQAILGTSLPMGGIGVPLGSLDLAARNRLMRLAQDDNVYQTSFNRTKKQRIAGRLVYTYEVTVRPSAYTKLMKQFAQSLGLSDLDQLDPSRYRNQNPLEMQLAVDVRSRHVVRVSAAGSQYEQIYTSYDVPPMLDLPTKTITGRELQNRLSKL